MTWERLYSESCPCCGARGTWDTMQHEPWCPNFMRTVDESDGRQLRISDEPPPIGPAHARGFKCDCEECEAGTATVDGYRDGDEINAGGVRLRVESPFGRHVN